MTSRLFRLALAALLVAATWVVAADAEAGLFNRRGRGAWSNRRSRATTTTYSNNRNALPLHMTHSRSAIVDGVFGPNPYGNGVDRSWYVGR